MAQGRRFFLVRLVRAYRIGALDLLDYLPDREGAEQNSYGSFVEAETSGHFCGSGWKLLKEPYLGRSIEGGDQPPICDRTGRGQKREVIFVSHLKKS